MAHDGIQHSAQTSWSCLFREYQLLEDYMTKELRHKKLRQAFESLRSEGLARHVGSGALSHLQLASEQTLKPKQSPEK